MTTTKEKARKASDNLDAVADKSRAAAHQLIDRVYDSKVTWLILGMVLAAAAYGVYRVLRIFM